MSKTRQPVATSEITNEAGFPGLVAYPEGANPEEGIPIHLNLETLYGHLPDEFQRQIYEALWARGLKLPEDYLTPDAANLFKSALLHVIKHNFSAVQTLAMEVLSHAHQ